MVPVRGERLRPRSPGGCFFVMRTLVLFDGQNLFRSAKDAWGPSYPYDHPSYDVELLAQRLVSLTTGRTLEEIRFYTGVYRKDQDWERHWFWTNKLDHLETQGAYVYRGRVRGGLNEAKQEKGVDVSLAIDLIQATHEQRYDVAIIMSKDSDFGPAVRLSKQIAQNQGRQLGFESAFPVAPTTPRQYTRGVPGTKWVHIDQATYDACRDWNDYRPPKK